MPTWSWARALLVLTLSLFGGCAFLRRAKTPMEVESFVQRGPAQAQGAIVLLPGFGDGPDAFREHGFVAALRQAAPHHDIYAADAHFGYYRSRTLLKRLDHDVLAPLRKRGYRELWLVGASMGGMGAVGYARTHPERIRGLLLFAPYLGPREVVEEVAQAGGLCRYQPPAQYQDDERGFARANFGFLRAQLCESDTLSVWLAVGADDRLLRANTLVGEALPEGRFVTLQGGHGWRVWTPAAQRIAPSALQGVSSP